MTTHRTGHHELDTDEGPATVGPTHTFDITVARSLTDAELDGLFDVAQDATPEVAARHSVLHFDREAPTLIEAIASAVLDVERAGLHPSGVGSPDLVELTEIAARTGRTRESIRLLAIGRRGPGGFPRPDGGFYLWAAVRDWFALYDPTAVDSPEHDDLVHDQTIAAADYVVRARALLPDGHAGALSTLLPA